jgi:hypothetical protein
MSSNEEDHNNDMEEDDDSKIFPQRLMEILSDERYGESITWLPHGRAFVIKNRKLFGEMVMPRYFSRKAKYSSFTRKLNRWYVTTYRLFADPLLPCEIKSGSIGGITLESLVVPNAE